MKGHPYEQGFDLRLVPDKLDAPLHWKKPRRVFVNSMSDLFHEEVPFEFIDKVFGVMCTTTRHTYQVLTKRADRMREYVLSREEGGFYTSIADAAADFIGKGKIDNCGPSWPFKNIWLGVSVESQKYANERIPHLLKTPAAVRFLSCEPLLEAVSLREAMLAAALKYPGNEVAGEALHWIICGGESGHGARPFDIRWARDLRDQCKAGGVPFFFKQAGSHVIWDGCSPPGGHWPSTFKHEETGGHFLAKLEAKKGNDLSELPEDLRIREFPQQKEK